MMDIVTGDRYLESLVKFVENQAGPLIEGTLVLKLNPVGLHYVYSRLEALAELESLLAGAPVDYLRAYVSDLGDHRALEQLRRILRLLTSLKVVSVLPPPARDPTPLSLLPFGRLKVLELRGCDLSTSAARGLLELKHSLEKLICHNSTDALRHVFASRIAEIKGSQQWNRLLFVSCTCNGLVLMDESLQLLPTVETLDLSRNKFSKVDNLRKCAKLKLLDLGFNHLRTIASLCEVSCQIVKLVLRNNALTALHGIENLKSLEGLDLSYNIISNFSELEILAGLPKLQSLWLEGNPLCCARWYRAQVFSFFPYPQKLKLDERKICKIELWKRQIIIASRQKRPASFGFYSHAKGDSRLEGSINAKRKKLTRLVSIETEEQSTCICSDQESVSYDNEIRSKEENTCSDEESELTDMINRIEIIKKERSVLWLQEFKEWMDQSFENYADSSKYPRAAFNPDQESYLQNKTRLKQLGESSRYVSDSVQASADGSSTNMLESDNSFADISIGFNAQQYFDQIGDADPKFLMGYVGAGFASVLGRIDNQEHPKSYLNEEHVSVRSWNSQPDSSAVPGSNRMGSKSSGITLAAIDDIMVSHSSSACLGSPPHYKEDILHRRHNLEEEFLQLSVDSYSVASSDSNTSCSEDDFTEFGSFIPKSDQALIDNSSERTVDVHSSALHFEETFDQEHKDTQLIQNGIHLSDPCSEQNADAVKCRVPNCSLQVSDINFPIDLHDAETVRLVKQESDWLEKKKHRRKSKRRVISLSEENKIDDGAKPLQKLNRDIDKCKDDVEIQEVKQVYHSSEHQESVNGRNTCSRAMPTSLLNYGGGAFSEAEASCLGKDNFIEKYFNSNIADFEVQETCRQYMCCYCMIEDKSGCRESEVAVLLSSEHKLYVLLINGTYSGPGTCLRLIGCHHREDVHEVVVGLGLQVVRLYIKRDSAYLFITRSIKKARELLCLLDFLDPHATKENCSFRSLEQVQVDLFGKHVCKDSKINILQYSMVLFWCNNLQVDSWLPRSLFLLKGHLFVCAEDLEQFGLLFEHAPASSYLSLDSCCSIVDISEMVIEMGENQCVTLALECSTSEFCTGDKTDEVEDAVGTKVKQALGPFTWKLKWFSEESLFKFVALLKAIHAAATTSHLLVRYVS